MSVKAVRPLRRVKPGIARTRDERFELIRAIGCWQVRSLTSEAASKLQGGGLPPVCPRRKDLADWLEEICER